MIMYHICFPRYTKNRAMRVNVYKCRKLRPLNLRSSPQNDKHLLHYRHIIQKMRDNLVTPVAQTLILKSFNIVSRALKSLVSLSLSLLPHHYYTALSIIRGDVVKGCG